MVYSSSLAKIQVVFNHRHLPITQTVPLTAQCNETQLTPDEISERKRSSTYGRSLLCRRSFVP